jgi:hypothetical protein
MQLIQRRMKEFNLWGDGSRFKVIDMASGSAPGRSRWKPCVSRTPYRIAAG